MLHIIIPAAGKGERFKKAGFDKPKPLIDVYGEPMISRVVSNLAPKDIDSRFLIIIRDESGFESVDWKVPDKSDVAALVLDHDTSGAVSTVLEAEEMLGDHPLIIANCDQLIIPFDMDRFLLAMTGYDAGVITFNSTNPHHSYVKIDNSDLVTEVAEKVVISDNAVAGIYYYAKGSEFLKYAKQMIEKNIRHNGEFYISPVYNEYIHDGKKVVTYHVDVEDKHMLGTPEELSIFMDKVESGRVSLT